MSWVTLPNGLAVCRPGCLDLTGILSLPRARIFAEQLLAACLAVLLAAASGLAAAAGGGPEGVTAVRAWTQTAPEVSFEAARDALANAPLTESEDGEVEFRTRPLHPVWLQLTLAPHAGTDPMVLELTHGAVRHAALYETDAQGRFTLRDAGLHAGFDLPDARFPATFVLPPSPTPRTVWLRLETTVVTHGEIRWLPESEWQPWVQTQFHIQSALFALALLVVVYALVRALMLGSGAYALYGATALSLGLTAMFITSYGSVHLWPALIPWRGPLVAALACISSGLVLLLARRAFALELSAPRWSKALLWVGIACALAGIAGSVLSVQGFQSLSHVAALTAAIMGVASIWLAWRTGNPVAIWLLAGFTPVMVAALVTTLGVAGFVPFRPWMLLAMPLAGVLEVPFNLYGLALLQRRRALLGQSLSAIAQGCGPHRENRAALLRRLAGATQSTGNVTARGMLTLLRFDGLAPGSEATRHLDPLQIETYFHSMMALAVRPGNQVGRWSLHELVVFDPQFRSELAMRDFISALFAQALRTEAFGLQPGQIGLRIAYGSLDAPHSTVEAGLTRLSLTLDNPALTNHRRITLNLNTGAVLWPLLPHNSVSPA